MQNWRLVLVLVLVLMLPLAVAVALASCRLLCCCLRPWDGSCGTAVNSAADTVAGLPLLLARCFFVLRYFFGLPRCRTSPLSSSILEASPAGFGLPRPHTHHTHRDQ